jgi:hypothetical protein
MTTETIAKNKKRINSLGLVIYFLGILLGAAVALLAIWGDLEASLFDSMMRAERPLNSLSCPVMMTQDEDVVITASFTNQGDRDENLSVRARVSQGYASLIREERMEFSLPPGESDTAVFHITADDAAWDRVVLARVSTVRNVPLRRLVGSSCGVLVLPIGGGISGRQILAALIAGSFLLTLLGGFLWQNGRPRPFLPKTQRLWRLMFALAGMVAAAMVAGLLQQWLLGGLILVVLFLLIISLSDSIAEGSAFDKGPPDTTLK